MTSNDNMQYSVLLGQQGWMCFNIRPTRVLPPRPNGHTPSEFNLGDAYPCRADLGHGPIFKVIMRPYGRFPPDLISSLMFIQWEFSCRL